MSSVYSYSALRFKITKDFENVNEMYKLFRGILGEPTEIEHESKWIDEKWVSTDEVVHFQYDDTKGNYNIRQDCETGEWYIDYLLDDHKESCDDVNVSIGLDELISIREKTLNKFSGIISEECKIKVYDWYSGCDMPIEF